MARFSDAASLLGNLLDQGRHRYHTFQVSLGAFLLAYAAVAVINLILYYGNDRYPDGRQFPESPQRPLTTFLSGTFAAALLTGFAVWRTEDSALLHALAAAGGFATALLLVILAKVIQLIATEPKSTPYPPPYLVLPVHRFPRLKLALDRLYCTKSEPLNKAKGAINRFSQWPLGILRNAGQGYLIDTAALPGSLKLRSGHVFALSMSSIALLLYLLVGWNKGFITAGEARVPALAYLLLFLNLACWTLSALTFFLDRYRVPLLGAVVVMAALTASAPRSDHFFRTERDRNPRRPTPSEFLARRLTPGRPANLVFVATPGGGIQAAAWTTQVLAGLNLRDPRFAESVCFISSVSGGSLGSLIFAAGRAGLIADPVANSRLSAIDEVAWGWTNPDVWRAIAPWFGNRAIDRGWALEEKWIAVNRLGAERKGPFETLMDRLGGRPADRSKDTLVGDWAQNEKVPALVFNSMVVERGQHVVFSNTDFPANHDRRGIVNFSQLYPGRDVRLATAARLSASFPYVAPAARPDVDPYAPGLHFVDGGYYDNYGINALIGWLTEARTPQIDASLGDILILQLRHFNAGQQPGGTVKGWGFQTYAPVSGLLSMWTAAPNSRNRNELELFLAQYANSKRGVWLVEVPFEGEKNCAPLSWKLSRSETGCLDRAWRAVPEKVHRCVGAYLSRSADGRVPPECGGSK